MQFRAHKKAVALEKTPWPIGGFADPDARVGHDFHRTLSRPKPDVSVGAEISLVVRATDAESLRKFART